MKADQYYIQFKDNFCAPVANTFRNQTQGPIFSISGNNTVVSMLKITAHAQTDIPLVVGVTKTVPSCTEAATFIC